MSRSPGAASTPQDREAYAEAWAALHRLLRQGKSESGRERNCVFLNTGASGSPRFATVSAATELDFPDDSRGMALCDWDHDGRVDFWMTNRTGPRVRLMLNRYGCDDSGWVGLRLRGDGRTMNRDAIGARAAIHLAGQRRPLLRTVTAGAGFLSQSSLWLHAGLGKGAEVERVVVRWLGGTTEEFTGVTAGSFHELVQGTGKAKRWTPPDARVVPVAPDRSPPPRDGEGPAHLVLIKAMPVPESFVPGGIGRRGTLLHLWSKDCPHCQGQLKAWASALPKWERAGLTVRSWCVDGSAAEAAAVCRAAGFRHPVLTRESPEIGADGERLAGMLNAVQKGCFGLQQDMPVPVSFLLDPRGCLVAIAKGPTGADLVTGDLSLFGIGEDERRRRACPDGSGRWHAPIQPAGLRGVVAALLDEGYKDEAEAWLRHAVEAHAIAPGPDDDEGWDRAELAAARSLLGLWALEKRRPDEAEGHYKASLEAAPSTEARRGLVRAWTMMRRRELHPLIAGQLEMLVRETGDAGDMGRLGVLLLESGRAAEAASLLTRSAEQLPDPLVLFQLGQARSATGESEAAARAWRACLQRTPDFLPALVNLTWLRATNRDATLRDGKEAVELAERALSAGGAGNPAVLGTYAAALAEAGRYDEAAMKATEAEAAAADAGQSAAADQHARAAAAYRRGEPWRQ